MRLPEMVRWCRVLLYGDKTKGLVHRACADSFLRNEHAPKFMFCRWSHRTTQSAFGNAFRECSPRTHMTEHGHPRTNMASNFYLCALTTVRASRNCKPLARAVLWMCRMLGLILTAQVGATAAANIEPATSRTALPPWLMYCDTGPCASGAPLIVASCAAANPGCMPARSTRIVAQVDGRSINSIMAILKPGDGSVRVVSGNGIADALSVTAFQAPYITFGSERDVLITYYDVVPVWGGTTAIRFTSTSLASTAIDTVFYRHASYDAGTAAADLHARVQTVVSTQQTMTGLTTRHVTVFFMPSEMSTVPGGEGNFSSGNGIINVNYGNPPYIATSGGIMQTAIPRFGHEYTHELFNQIATSYRGNSSCLNEGVADALPYV